MPYNYAGNQQGFGWFGATPYGNQQPNNNNPQMPKAPNTNLYQPNFAPPVYYPNQFQYPTFPNFNLFPFAPPFGFNPQGQNPQSQGPHAQRPQDHDHNQNPQNQYPQQFPTANGQPTQGQRPPNSQNPQFPGNQNQGQGQNNRVNTDNHGDQSTNHFATDAFFGNNHNHQWTEDDEMKWQATTKAPYFENKVPGLECTLPASAVLGATTALKASSLLPLNVPIGKPILSCNASQLLQAQINLDGIIYDCNGPSIVINCPRYDSRHELRDECRGETLECDVRMHQNTRRVSCTNGTLISNHAIICKSATLMEHKNVLNCLFKSSTDSSVIPLQPQRPVQVTNRPPPVHVTSRPQPTSRPIRTTTVSLNEYIPPAVPVTDDPIESFDTRHSDDNLFSNDLNSGVKRALVSVFPHELLMAPSRMVLPPKTSSAGQIPEDLKNQLRGVFPYALFATSHSDDSNGIDNLYVGDNTARLSTATERSANSQQSITQMRESQWNLNLNTKSGNSGASTKTKPVELGQRFGGEDNHNNNGDRLIFSP